MNFLAITKKSLKEIYLIIFFENEPHIGICVSGGSDSMALLFLMKEWIKRLMENTSVAL